MHIVKVSTKSNEWFRKVLNIVSAWNLRIAMLHLHTYHVGVVMVVGLLYQREVLSAETTLQLE